MIISSSAADANVTLENTASVNSLVCDVSCNIEGSGRISQPLSMQIKSILSKSLAMSRCQKESRLQLTERPSPAAVPAAAAAVRGAAVRRKHSSYSLTLEANPKGAATLQGGGVYKAGTSVTLNVTPLPGWSFDNWTVNGKIVSTKAKFVYVMPKDDVTVTANITKNYKLSVLASPSGGGEVTKSGEYAAGTVFTVTATPKAGYVFDHWEVDGEIQSVDESFTSVMPYKDTVFTAVFLPENTKDTWNGQTANVIYKLKDGSYLVTRETVGLDR